MATALQPLRPKFAPVVLTLHQRKPLPKQPWTVPPLPAMPPRRGTHTILTAEQAARFDAEAALRSLCLAEAEERLERDNPDLYYAPAPEYGYGPKDETPEQLEARCAAVDAAFAPTLAEWRRKRDAWLCARTDKLVVKYHEASLAVFTSEPLEAQGERLAWPDGDDEPRVRPQHEALPLSFQGYLRALKKAGVDLRTRPNARAFLHLEMLESIVHAHRHQTTTDAAGYYEGLPITQSASHRAELEYRNRERAARGAFEHLKAEWRAAVERGERDEAQALREQLREARKEHRKQQRAIRTAASELRMREQLQAQGERLAWHEGDHESGRQGGFEPTIDFERLEYDGSPEQLGALAEEPRLTDWGVPEEREPQYVSVVDVDRERRARTRTYDEATGEYVDELAQLPTPLPAATGARRPDGTEVVLKRQARRCSHCDEVREDAGVAGRARLTVGCPTHYPAEAVSA